MTSREPVDFMWKNLPFNVDLTDPRSIQNYYQLGFGREGKKYVKVQFNDRVLITSL
jgi:hypothetical protein